MTLPKRHKPVFQASAVLASCWLVACATPAPEPTLPPLLQAPAGDTFALLVPARGVQIYECREAATGMAWAFVAPEAQLFDTSGKLIGQHGAGPHWQALDGSRIVGTVRQRADAPVAAAIPWLLLSTKAEGPAGVFSRVASIQRINTVGGVAPVDGCAAADKGRQVRVPYTADYRLFNAARS